MNSFAKSSLAGVVFSALLVNQVDAYLPAISFESPDYLSGSPIGAAQGTGWSLLTGAASVSPPGTGSAGGQALKLAVNPNQEALLKRSVEWDSSAEIAFIDLQLKPAADPEGSYASFFANGTQLAFQVPMGGQSGEIWVYNGGDGAANPAQWAKTVGTFALAGNGLSASDYTRITLRHDYQRDVWDLFIGGKLAAANLAFESRGESLAEIEFYGSKIADTFIDDLSALPQNILFPDADKDGLPDTWEIANGSNPNLYDRDALKPGTNKSFLDHYMDSLWTGGLNGSAPLPPQGSIPPLTIMGAHQPVGSLKGSMSVGADGAAGYAIPIDIPKGTAGMEPRISLNYSSNGGNGIAGIGWSLGGLQRITRGPSSAAKEGSFDPMDFDSSDRYFLDGEKLICISGTYGAAGSEYRTEIDAFSRITAIGGTAGAGPASWKAETKAGLVIFFGETADSRQEVSQGVLSWGVNKVMDTAGNYYSVEYVRDAPGTEPFDFVNDRVSAIHYTGNAGASMAPLCRLNFDYETRSDVSRAHTTYAGYKVTKRLSAIRVMTGSHTNHSYRLSYSNTHQTGRSVLASITKLMLDDPTLALPATVFEYDGLAPGEPIWRNGGALSFPVYGTGWDASAQQNSMVSITDEGNQVQLTGDVSRAYVLPSGGVTLHADSVLLFEFKSSLLEAGAAIGFDTDGTYQSSPARLFRIGGSGGFPVSLKGTRGYSSPNAWQTMLVDVGQAATGLHTHLVLMCVDENLANGVSDAAFRNLRLYRTGSQQPHDVEPMFFGESSMSLPRLYNSNGKDLGIRFMDLDSDGLVDIADWKCLDYLHNPSLALTPQTQGVVWRNVGGSFAPDSTLVPPPGLPLSTRDTYGTAAEFEKKHHLFAKPLDVDGDGRLDLLGAKSIIRTWGGSGGQLKNEWAFYHIDNGTWVERPEWALPFRSENTNTSWSAGGPSRDHHFEWADLNSDGYPDLVVRNTDYGRLYDTQTNTLILGANGTTAFLNKGKNGPGWIRADSLGLPEALHYAYNEIPNPGRHLVDIDGDGRPEIAESSHNGSTQIRRTYRMLESGSYLWNSTPGLKNPPADPFNLPVSVRNGNGASNGVILMDCNGDGLTDVAQSSYNNGNIIRRTWMNQGSRTATPWVEEASSAYASSSPDSYCLSQQLHFAGAGGFVPYGFEQADLNGDGLVDILFGDNSSHLAATERNLAIMNTGNGWQRKPEWGLPAGKVYANTPNESESGIRRAKLIDLNGDGFPDLLTDTLNQAPKLWMNNCRPEVLTSVTDGFGSELQVEYRRLNDPSSTDGFGSRVYEKFTGTLPAGQARIIDSRLVVSRYSEADGQGGRRWKSQRYGDLRFDRNHESSLGFGWIEALDESNGQLTRTDFRRDFPFAGSPMLTQTSVNLTAADIAAMPPNAAGYPALTPGHKVLTIETAQYAEMTSLAGTGGTIRRPVQTSSVKHLFDLDGTLKGETVTTQLLADFDAYGFVKKSTITSLDGFSVQTTNTYAHATTGGKWHLGRLTHASVKKGYSPLDERIKNSSFAYSSTTGLLTLETIEPGTPHAVTTAYTHDAYGNVVMTSVTARPDINLAATQMRSSATGFDSRGRFVTAESNAVGTVQYQYDPQKALLNSTTDINGLTTYFTYDPFGTLILTHHPDGTKTGEITGYAVNASLPSSVAAHVTNPIRFFRAKQSSGAPAGKVYLDAQGREIVTETIILRNAGSSGSDRYRTVYTVTKYDHLGRKTAVSESFGSTETPLFTTISYDILSRAIKTIHPDGQWSGVVSQGAGTFTSHLGPVRMATYSKSRNQANQILERWEDEHGRLAQSKDPSGQITTFAYDVEGRLTNAIIGNGSLLTNIYDAVGNKTGVIEANSGYSQSQYNGFGELVRTISARGDVTEFTYDSVGRPVSVIKPEGTYTTLYSAASGPTLGKPLSITGTGAASGYQETFSYDSLGRPVGTTKTQFGETFSTSTVYDALGRVASSTDAGGLTVFSEYDPTYSFPLKQKLAPGTYEGAGTVLWQAGTYDSKGRTLTQTLAQGVTTASTYHPTRGDLTALSSSWSGGALQDKAYAWDGLGNLTSRTDQIAKRHESFGYDHLNRLASSSVSSLAGAPTSTVPPPQSYYYSTKGNLHSKGNSASLTYNDPTRIHAVTSAFIKGSSRTYSYDAAGYVVSDGKRTYQWTSFGQLRQLDYLAAPDLRDFSGNLIHAASRVTSTFDFDSGGNRARQTKERIAANDSRKIEHTLYLGSYEREIHQTKANAGASSVLVKTLHRHSLGGGVVYTRTTGGPAPGAKLMNVLADHLGSTDVILTGIWNGSSFTNHTTERQSFDAWGERRAADTQVNFRATDSDAFRTSGHETDHYDRGYTGHEQLDDSGLIHMNGRIYDPELGRFLAPDPYVQIPEYSQNFNRYSYVLNNPLNATDPSGFSFVSKLFHKKMDFIKENWRTIVVIVVVIVVTIVSAGSLSAGAAGVGASILGGTAAAAVTAAAGSWAVAAIGGAFLGSIAGGLTAALHGGDLGDILRGRAIGAISGAITSGALHTYGEAAAATSTGLDDAAHVVGHGVVGGASNVAMGGKFSDGFFSAAAGAAAGWLGVNGLFQGSEGAWGIVGRTAISGAVGGTVSVLGGGKFANGAFTAAFQHLLNAEMGKWSQTHFQNEDFRIDSNVYGNEADGVRSGKVQIQLSKGNEEFKFDMNKKQWLNSKGQMLPKSIRKQLLNNPRVGTKLSEAFERLRSNGIDVPVGIAGVALVAGVILWNGQVRADVATYQAAMARGHAGTITEARINMVMSAPMTDAQQALLMVRLGEIDGGD